MADPLYVAEGEMSVDEVLDALNEGRRVVVSTEFLGSEHEVTLRWDGETYYCDTPTQLHKHAEEAEMRECIENQGYSRDDSDPDQ
jgi:hemin uptake protein HemP